MPRPDQSLFLAHFTKDEHEFDEINISHTDPNPISAIGRLVSILQSKKIYASELPWTGRKAVCFTECPWGSLIRHAEAYSPYGIGFTKKFIYSRGGNPVIYANPRMFDAQYWEDSIYPFVTPFVPSYASDSIKRLKPFNGRTVDYSHEREWRTSKDLLFQYNNIVFVVLNRYSDMQIIPESIVKEIGESKFIFMETYKKIEELWPTHIMT